MDLQHVPDGGGTGRKASLIKFSRRYRSVVRACILDLEEKSGMFLCYDLLHVDILNFMEI